MVTNGAFSHKIDYITSFYENISLKGQQNRITGPRVTAILLNGWIFPIGQSDEASWWRVCYQRSLPCLVFELIITSKKSPKYVFQFSNFICRKEQATDHIVEGCFCTKIDFKCLIYFISRIFDCG